ncbi:MAG: hypothetical protein ABSF53_05325 [Terracidiphilus sp.]
MLDRIWDSLYTLFRSQNAIERERFLGDIAVIAVFQPERVERIAQIAMDEPVESVRFWSFRRVTQDDVFRHVSPLLGVTIFHEPTSRDAFERLWRLAQHSDAEVHNAARKALKDAIAYRKYKSVDFNERILSLVEEKSTDSEAYRGNFTPLTLIDEILEREVDDHSFRGNTFSFTALSVNYAVIAPLRAADASHPGLEDDVTNPRLCHPGRHERRARVRHHASDGSQDHCDVAALYKVRRDLSRERRGRPRNLNTPPRPGKNHFSDPGERAARQRISSLLSNGRLGLCGKRRDERLLCRT